MLLANLDLSYSQQLNPLGDSFWTAALSTFFAALPVFVLFYLLVPRRWLASKAGAAGALSAILIAIFIYGMSPAMALWSFGYGAAFGLLPVGWTIFNAMLLYNITVETGQFTIVKRSVAGLSKDARIQAILIGFSFGAFLEGAAGGGTPVAICGAIMVGLGFNPFLAAVLCLIANTSPVAYGGLGTPIEVLKGVTGIPGETLSTMAGHQLPFLSLLVPAYMVRCMCSWKKTWEVWPALFVAGGSFAVFQYFFATFHDWFPKIGALYHMTDIGGGIFSLVVTAVFLQFWKPKEEIIFDQAPLTPVSTQTLDPNDPHAAEAAALMGGGSQDHSHETKPLTAGNITLAWMPFVLMSIFLMLTGILRQNEGGVSEGPGKVEIVPGLSTNYLIPVPTLHTMVERHEKLRDPNRKLDSATLPSWQKDEKKLKALENALVKYGQKEKFDSLSQDPSKREEFEAYLKTVGQKMEAETAVFNFAWVSSPGSPVLFAALVSMLMLRMSRRQIGRVLHRTCLQMKIPIPTIAFMLGLSYVTRYAGMDATLGYAFANTGVLYPFFAAILGWLGVFLTGTDAGSNALFGSLQKITATEIYTSNPTAFANLTLEQTQVIICTANSTGGVMGKMIDAQSICVATAATHQLGKEADIFKAVVWHSIILASIVGALTLIQTYVWPFTLMVPHP